MTVDLPPGWVRAPEPPDGTDLVAAEPGDPDAPGAFRANVVVTRTPLGGMSFRDWQAGTDELLPRTLEGYLLVDLERVAVGGAPGGRRLAHHTGPCGEALTLEQWFVAVGDVGHTLTATCPTPRYDELADPVARVAASWRPGVGA